MNHFEDNPVSGIFLPLFFVVLFLMAVTANAQGRPQGLSLEDLVAALNLSDEQAAAVGPILDDARVRRELIVEAHADKAGRERMKAMRPEFEAISAELDEQLAAVLDEEQMDKYLELKEDQRKQAREQMFRRQR